MSYSMSMVVYLLVAVSGVAVYYAIRHRREQCRAREARKALERLAESGAVHAYRATEGLRRVAQQGARSWEDITLIEDELAASQRSAQRGLAVAGDLGSGDYEAEFRRGAN